MRDDAGEAAVVFGVSGLGKREDFRRSVGDEEFLIRIANALASVFTIYLRSIGLEPGPVAIQACPPCSGIGQGGRVGYFFHHYGGMFRDHR
jgi:hypothetical protein